MKIELLKGEYSVCKVADYSAVDWSRKLVFVGQTDMERSLVCETAFVPDNVLVREDGWRAMRVAGNLDFSLVGILSHISGVLAAEKISIFAVSTYDTDYILVRSADLSRALAALSAAGMTFD